MKNTRELVKHVSRVYETSPGAGANVRVKVCDFWDVSGDRVFTVRTLEFQPETGDLRAQIEARLAQ